VTANAQSDGAPKETKSQNVPTPEQRVKLSPWEQLGVNTVVYTAFSVAFQPLDFGRVLILKNGNDIAKAKAELRAQVRAAGPYAVLWGLIASGAGQGLRRDYKMWVGGMINPWIAKNFPEVWPAFKAALAAPAVGVPEAFLFVPFAMTSQAMMQRKADGSKTFPTVPAAVRWMVKGGPRRIWPGFAAGAGMFTNLNFWIFYAYPKIQTKTKEAMPNAHPFLQRLAAIAPTSVLACCLGGGQWNMISTIQADQILKGERAQSSWEIASQHFGKAAKDMMKNNWSRPAAYSFGPLQVIIKSGFGRLFGVLFPFSLAVASEPELTALAEKRKALVTAGKN
jgi:hypothetical protein